MRDDLNPRAHQLACQFAAKHSKKALADRIGYKRSTASLYVDGVYTGNIGKVEAAILLALDTVSCPFLQQELTLPECQRYATRKVPSNSPSEVQHWRACQSCPNKPEVQP